LVTDLVTGGDLRYHICKNKKFSEEQTKFFVVCCLIGLEYMHNNGVIHRDIKPENLLMDCNGYIRITDLGISREWSPDNS
jgi:serine/threonine protein kinase